jgi:hypothetical protein
MSPSGKLRRVALTIATRRNIPDNGILHSQHRENLESHIQVAYIQYY